MDDSGGRKCGRRKRRRQIRNGQAADGECGIERRVLIHAISERVLQVVVHSETGANHGLVAEGAPRHADARLGQELRVVDAESGIADVSGSGQVDHAVR